MRKSISKRAWIVNAFFRVICVSRFAARPVGAARKILSVSFSMTPQDRIRDRAFSRSGPARDDMDFIGERLDDRLFLLFGELDLKLLFGPNRPLFPHRSAGSPAGLSTSRCKSFAMPCS